MHVWDSFLPFFCDSVDSEYFGPPFYEFEKVHEISTNRIKIFGQITIKRLLSNEHKFIEVNNEPNIFKNASSWVILKYDRTYIQPDNIYFIILIIVISNSNRGFSCTKRSFNCWQWYCAIGIILYHISSILFDTND